MIRGRGRGQSREQGTRLRQIPINLQRVNLTKFDKLLIQLLTTTLEYSPRTKKKPSPRADPLAKNSIFDEISYYSKKKPGYSRSKDWSKMAQSSSSFRTDFKNAKLKRTVEFKKRSRSRKMTPRVASREYVKKKKLEVGYQNLSFKTKKYKVNYNLHGVLEKINEAHQWRSETSRWVLDNCLIDKEKLGFKGQRILGLQEVSDEGKLRMLNLKNSVSKCLIAFICACSPAYSLDSY